MPNGPRVSAIVGRPVRVPIVPTATSTAAPATVPRDDQQQHEAVVHVGDEQRAGEQRGDDEVGREPDHEQPAGRVGAAHADRRHRIWASSRCSRRV